MNRAERGIRSGAVFPSFGILYPGEMGASFGEVLSQQHFEVFTALRGRSRASRERASKAGIQDLGDVGRLVRKVDFIISLVPPDAAKAVATIVTARVTKQDRCAFVDLNSIGPDVVRDIAKCIGESGIDYIDGSVHGQARHLGSSSVVYLSGLRSNELVQILGGSLRVYGLGGDVAAASRFKMLLSALSKSLVTLLLEVGIFARKVDQLPFFLEQARYFYPGLMEAVERMAPTYPRHVDRRLHEMMNVEHTISQLGLRPSIASESYRFLEEFAAAGLPSSRLGSVRWTVEDLIEALAAAGLLRDAGPLSAHENDEGVKEQSLRSAGQHPKA